MLHASRIDLVPLDSLDSALGLFGTKGLSELVSVLKSVRVGHRLEALEVLEALDLMSEEVGWRGGDSERVGFGVMEGKKVSRDCSRAQRNRDEREAGVRGRMTRDM